MEAFDIHGDDDQILPIGASALISSKMVKRSTRKIYPGAPHRVPEGLAIKPPHNPP